MDRLSLFVRKNLGLSFVPVLLLGVVAGCGGDDEDSDTSTTVAASVAMNLISVSDAASSRFAPQAKTRAPRRAKETSLTGGVGDCIEARTTPNAFEFQDGATGAPEYLKIRLKKIELTGDAESTTVFESSSTEGEELTLASGKVDLSGLTFKTEFTAGTYTGIKLTLVEKALIKGCVSGTYNGMYASGNALCGASNASCEPMTAGAFTYCTTTGQDIYTRFATNSTEEDSRDDFGTTAQEMAIRLSRSAVASTLTALDPTAEVSFEFPAAESIVIAAGSSLKLSMVIDLNAFMKFDFNSRNYSVESSSGEQFLNMADKAFFFPQALTDVAMVFAGDPGVIEGYSVDSCAVLEDYPSDTTWTRNWMTLIFDADGGLMSGLVSTMDPTGYVALNGTINGAAASTRPSTVASSAYTLNLGSTVSHGSLVGFTRVTTIGESGYIAFGQSPKTTIASGEGEKNFDWKYTLELKNSNPLE